MKISDDAFEALITLSILIFIMIIFSCLLTKLTKGTFCCKYKIQNIEETLPV